MKTFETILSQLGYTWYNWKSYGYLMFELCLNPFGLVSPIVLRTIVLRTAFVPLTELTGKHATAFLCVAFSSRNCISLVHNDITLIKNFALP